MAKAKKAKKLTIKQRSERSRKGWETRKRMAAARLLAKGEAYFQRVNEEITNG